MLRALCRASTGHTLFLTPARTVGRLSPDSWAAYSRSNIVLPRSFSVAQPSRADDGSLSFAVRQPPSRLTLLFPYSQTHVEVVTGGYETVHVKVSRLQCWLCLARLDTIALLLVCSATCLTLYDTAAVMLLRQFA